MRKSDATPTPAEQAESKVRAREVQLNSACPRWPEHLTAAQVQALSDKAFQRLMVDLQKRLWWAAHEAFVKARFGPR